jgi:hypothetical protein
MSVATVTTRVATLFEDRGQKWCTKDYVQSFLAIHNEDVEAYLESLDLSYDTDVIVLSNVTAGATDLSAFQAEGGLLANMTLPTALEWKLPEEDDSKYQPIPRADKVRDVPTAEPFRGIASFEWRKGIVYLTPSSVDVTIRVRCETLPASLDEDSGQYIKGLTNVLVYGVAAMIAFARGGPASKLGLVFQDKYEKALGTVEDTMIKNDQLSPRRMAGRRSGYSGPTWRIPVR